MSVVERDGEADPFYYLVNFQLMLDTLLQRDGDLLTVEETAFVVVFSQLPLLSRAMLVRMAMRKGDLFRSSRLVYAEIADREAAMAPLVLLKWVDDKPRLTLEELFRLLTKTEITRSLKLGLKSTEFTKTALFEELKVHYPEPRRLDQWGSAADQVYRLQVDGLCVRLRLMFFGNFRQDLREFVLADLGIFKYETVDLRESRPFRTRAQVDAFHQLYRCRELLYAGADPAAVAAALPHSGGDCEWLEDRREKLRFQIGREYERAGAVTEAALMYERCSYPEASRRGRRLKDRVDGIAKYGSRGARMRVPEFSLVLKEPVQGYCVERSVLDHLALAEPLSQVRYVENGLINSLFGLLCWPAIFAPIPGAFFHRFHQGPADLSSARFLERRQQQFALCLAELRCGAYKETVRRRWAEKTGIASPFVTWGLIDESLLEMALACFPAAHLVHWFEWIMRDVRANRSGFADLVQFWPDACRYRLIEVKGPRDRLQENQRRWMEFCLTAGMPVQVCWVKWAVEPG